MSTISTERNDGKRNYTESTGNTELKIARVVVTEDVQGIPLKGWDTVQKALVAFAARKTKGSKIEEAYERGVLQESLGEWHYAAINATYHRTPQESIDDARKMLVEAKAKVNEFGQWHEDFSHHRFDAFTCASVGISKLPDHPDAYLFTMYGPNAKRELEEGIAQHLGIGQRGLRQIEILVELAAESDMQLLNFAQVANILTPVTTELRPQKQMKQIETLGEVLARHFTKIRDNGYPESNPYILGIKDGVQLDVNVGNDYRHSNNRVLWKAQGPNVSIPLEEAYDDPNQKIPFALNFTAHPARIINGYYETTIDPKMQQSIRALATDVASAFDKAK